MGSANSPGSPLSSLSSEDFDHQKADDDADASPHGDRIGRSLRPSKRRRTGAGWDSHQETPEPPHEPDVDVSSDTEGSVPASPTHSITGTHDDDALGHEQVTACKWDGCVVGDLGNMDKLVDHIHNDHIGQQLKKHSCEWESCPRKGITHASNYALRAHIRSHTREKPFYCSLPECDRCFPRSDALAKHMRTVHETDPLRPSDHAPKTHSSFPTNRQQRLRLIFSNSATNSNKQSPVSPSDPTSLMNVDDTGISHARDPADARDVASSNGDPPSRSNAKYILPPDVSFDDEESQIPIDQLFHRLRGNLAAAEAETDTLKEEVTHLEEKRLHEWIAKELVLENVMEMELHISERRAAESQNPMNDGIHDKMSQDVEYAKNLEIVGGSPWWRGAVPAKLDITPDRDDEDEEGETAIALPQRQERAGQVQD